MSSSGSSTGTTRPAPDGVPHPAGAETAEPVGAELVELDVEAPAERSGSVTPLVAAGVSLMVGVAALVNSYQLGIGTLTEPGAGLWPAGASAVMVAASIILVTSYRRTEDCERFGRGTLTIGLATASLGVFLLLFGGVTGWPGIGVEASLAALMVFWLKVLGRESWLVTAVVTVVVTAAAYLFFLEVLGAPIPHVIGW